MTSPKLRFLAAMRWLGGALVALGRGLGAALRTALLLLVSVALVAIVLVTIAWEFPEAWLNPSTLERAARWLGPETRIEWSRAIVAVRKPSTFRRDLALDFEGLRVDAGPLRLTIPSAGLRATVQLGWSGLRVRVDGLDVEGKTLAFTVADEASPKGSETDPGMGLPPWLDVVDVGRVRIAFEEATIAAERWVSRVALLLQAAPEGRGVRWELEAQSRTRGNDAGEVVADARVRLTSLAGPWFGPYTAKAFVQAREKSTGTATVSLAGTPTVEGTSDFRGSLTATLPSKMRVRATFALAVSPQRIQFSPTGTVEFPTGPLARVEVARCPTTLARPMAELPKRLRCEGVFRARDPRERWDGQSWRLDASPTRWELAFDDLAGVRDATARAVATLDAATDVPLTERRIVASVEARIGDYAALARKLYPGDLSIPQPFASLAGDVRLRADWTGSLHEITRSSTVLVWSATSALASPRQRFRTSSKGLFRLGGERGRNELEAEVVLEDVALDLPEMNLAPIRLLPDRRIRPFEAAVAEAEPGLRYRITVRTPEGNPIKLRSNLAQGLVPIAMNLLLTDDAGPRGSITVLSFPVEFFRRRGELERLKVAFSARGGNPVIDGTFRVRYAEYVITLKAIGPASKPTFEASSEPPLPERDVWAALLFGRKLETGSDGEQAPREPALSVAPQAGSPFASRLSTEDARSASEMQAAAVDGGLSLATMYLLASTPVESVSYNPASGEVRAAVRLADGAALTVGSDLRTSGSVGFRYRLGNNWYVTTTLEDAFDFTNARLGTRLEWTRRY
jgi:hypothetical protein